MDSDREAGFYMEILSRLDEQNRLLRQLVEGQEELFNAAEEELEEQEIQRKE